MGDYILCQTKKAEHPYFVENISTNIYSIEELCYYLYHNLYLIDGTIMNQKLCVWLKEELALGALADRLSAILGKFTAAEDILYPIFKEINYLTYEEQKNLNARLTQMDREPLLLREKKKGDAMMENAMYVNAIRIYEGLLKKEGLSEAGEGMTAAVWNNLGCAYSRLFQMEKATECFLQAWEADKTDEALKTYLLAFRSIRTPIEFESRISELNVSGELRAEIGAALGGFAKKPETPVYSQHIDKLLEDFVRDYHRSTGS